MMRKMEKFSASDDPHSALLDYIREEASKLNWNVSFIKHLTGTGFFIEFKRPRSGLKDQRLKIIVRNGKASSIKTATDNLWYDMASVFDLADPDSLEKIVSYFVH